MSVACVTRVLIVDDQPIFRHGLIRLMESEPDLTVCGEVDGAEHARALLTEMNPDALVCDIALKHFEGIELVRHVRAHHPRLPILVFSAQDETVYAQRMLAVGATGYIMKNASAQQFLASLRRVLAGNIYLSETVSNRLLYRYKAGNSYAGADPIERLSTREVQVLAMIGTGLSTRETAHRLHLSIKTIESHRQRIKKKMHLNSATQLMRYAVLDLVRRDQVGIP